MLVYRAMSKSDFDKMIKTGEMELNELDKENEGCYGPLDVPDTFGQVGIRFSKYSVDALKNRKLLRIQEDGYFCAFDIPEQNLIPGYGFYRATGSPADPLSTIYPEVMPLSDRCIKELFNDGLMNTESIHTTMTANGMVSKRTTGLGDEFLNFISIQGSVN